MSKKDIDKIDEQIELLKKDMNGNPTGEVEVVTTKIVDPKDENHEINISYINSEVKESTKEIKDLKTLVNNEENVEVTEAVEEDTKEVEIISDTTSDNEDTKAVEPVDVVEEKVEDSTIVNETTEAVSTPKNNKNLLIILGVVIGVLIFVLIICCFTFLNFGTVDEPNNNKDKEEVEEKLTEKQMVKILNSYASKLETEINSYYVLNNNKIPDFYTVNEKVDLDYDVVCYVHEIYEDRKIYLDECMVDYVDVEFTYGEKQDKKVEEPDNNNIKVYVHRVTKEPSLNEPADMTDYILYASNSHCVAKEIKLIPKSNYVYFIDESGLTQIYNYVLGRKFLNNETYETARLINIKQIAPEDRMPGVYYSDETISNEYVVVTQNHKDRLYDLRTSKPVGEIYDSINNNEITHDHLVVVKDEKSGLLNYKGLRETVKTEYSEYIVNGNYIIFVKDKKGYLYNMKSNSFFENVSKEGFEMNAIVDQYMLYKGTLHQFYGYEKCKFKYEDSYTIENNEFVNDKVIYTVNDAKSKKCFVYDTKENECSTIEYDECKNLK